MSTGGSVTELVSGLGAIIMPILGLAGLLSVSLAAASFVMIGGGVMIQGIVLGLRDDPTLAGAPPSTADTGRSIGSTSAAVLGGTAVIALGVLALLGTAPRTLLAIAAVLGGGALAIGSRAISRLRDRHRHLGLGLAELGSLSKSLDLAIRVDILAGLSATLLGILALASTGGSVQQLTLVLAAAITLGAAMLLEGATVARAAALVQR